MRKELARYKIWLKESARYYEVSEKEIINGCKKPDVVVARQTFYWLCWRDNINLPNLSRELGKDRTSICATMNQTWKRRDRDTENHIYEKITAKENLSKRTEEVRTDKEKFCYNVAVPLKPVLRTAPRG